MTFTKHLKLALAAWGIPILIILVAISLSRPILNDTDDLLPATFIPQRIYIQRSEGGFGSDWFELRIISQDGEVFFHRDPESEPIHRILHRIRQGERLDLRYVNTIQGNVLLQVAHAEGDRAIALSAKEVIEEQERRLRIVYITATIWFGIGTVVLFLIWFFGTIVPAQRLEA
jgi:hypothetical protein